MNHSLGVEKTLINANTVFVYISAYSPKTNIIASKRAQLLSKNISNYYSTYVVAGCPRTSSTDVSIKKYVENGYTLIEIPTLFRSINQSRETSVHTVSRISLLFRRLKIELLPFLEIFFPISPGGMLFHNKLGFVREIDKIIRANKDKRIVLFASYGPLFVPKIALHFKQRYLNVQYVIDFRDWGYKYYEGFFYKSIIFRQILGRLVKRADFVSSVSLILLQKYQEYFLLDGAKTIYLPNGYDSPGMNIVDSVYDSHNSNSFVISYTGSIHIKSRNPEVFIRALKRVYLEIKKGMIDTRLTFVYAGKDSDVVQYYFSKYGMEEILEDRKLVSREESQRIQSESDLLLLLTYTGKYNEIFGSIVTGKIYEYLLCNVPILVIGQENWELAPLIRMKHGSSLVPNREENIYAYLVQSIRSRKSHRKETDEFRNRLRAYSYETISSSLVEFLEFQKQ